jgi:hypothetical protein
VSENFPNVPTRYICRIPGYNIKKKSSRYGKILLLICLNLANPLMYCNSETNVCTSVRTAIKSLSSHDRNTAKDLSIYHISVNNDLSIVSGNDVGIGTKAAFKLLFNSVVRDIDYINEELDPRILDPSKCKDMFGRVPEFREHRFSRSKMSDVKITWEWNQFVEDVCDLFQTSYSSRNQQNQAAMESINFTTVYNHLKRLKVIAIAAGRLKQGLFQMSQLNQDPSRYQTPRDALPLVMEEHGTDLYSPI